MKLPSPKSCRSAFTLIELLTVVAIVGILAAILIPVVGNVRKSAQNTNCVSNLRQIGHAMALYTNDHNGRLPGPIYSGTNRYLQAGRQNDLIFQLQPYLGLPEPSGDKYYPEILHCHAVDGVLGDAGSWIDVVTYVAYSKWDLPPGMRYIREGDGFAGPWGHANLELPPMTMAQLSARIDETMRTPAGNAPTLSEVPALRETDETQKSWPWAVPEEAPHGDHLNALFFDWHVEGVPASHYQM